MKNISAFGFMQDGKIKLSFPSRFKEECKGFKDGDVEVIVKVRHRRSLPQNRYLFGVVYKEMQARFRELGNDLTLEDVHEFCKEKFNTEYIRGQDETVLGTKGGNTSSLNVEEFGEYIDKIVLWSAEFLCISIPAPGAALKFNFQ